MLNIGKLEIYDFSTIIDSKSHEELYDVMGFGKVLVRSWSTNWAKKMKRVDATGSGSFRFPESCPSFNETCGLKDGHNKLILEEYKKIISDIFKAFCKTKDFDLHTITAQVKD